MKVSDSIARALKWATPAVVVVQSGLVATGVLDLRSAITIALVIEAVLFLAVIMLAVFAGGTYRNLRRDGATRGAALGAAARKVLPGPVVVIMRHEFRMFHSLWLMVRGRIDAPVGATTFRYGASQAPMFYVLIVVSLVEIGVVHWIVPWAWVRIVLGFLGIYGAIWLLGFYQAFRRRPHYAYDGILVLRCGFLGEITMSTADIVKAYEDFHSWGTRSFAVRDEAGSRPVVSLTPSGMTDVTLQLTDEAVVSTKDRELRSPVIHVSCDDPSDMVRYLRTAPAGSVSEKT